ncbi:hypothetical protein [Paracidovorax sp. MALMAid1276]|uniref:hypothetical protein n=1 Tax=Paracidovorax sp. MALMAid1276 TaxID=3411631 RepID=UPI003B98F4E3
MNKRRRDAIQTILDELQVLRERIESVRDEEQEAFVNLPDSLQQGSGGQKMDEAVSALDVALDGIDEAAASLDEAQA